MPLSGIRIGDVVKCDVKGRQFYALVEAREAGGLAVKPITHNTTYRHVTSQQVLEHFRKSKQGPRRRPAPAQNREAAIA